MSLWRNLFKRTGVEQELDEELRAYLDQSTAEKRAAGMSAAEALRAARVELGGIEQVKEQVRDVRVGHMAEELMQDLRYGLRSLRKNPAFTMVAIFALALGIGANTAMFSVAYGILARPLAYPQADRIAVVYMRYFPRDFPFGTMSIRDYLMWKDNNHAFEEPSLFTTRRMDIGGNEGTPEQVQGAAVTTGFFSTLQVKPLIGRTFQAGEDNANAQPMSVLSESIWRRRFAASTGVLGESILVNGAPSTIIGVMPEAFGFPRQETEVWTNLPLVPPARFGPWFYRGVARLKPGVTIAQAQAETNDIGMRLMQQNSYYKRVSLPVLSMRDAMLGTTLKPAILVLMGAVGLVLLIAVVNVANLMLARATVRQREMALRLSLGAGRARLVRQLLTESVVLSVAGGIAGLGLAWGGIELIRTWNPGNLPFIDSVRLDWSALGFMLLVSIVTGVLFGLAPAFESAHTDLNSTMKEGGRAGSRRGGTRSMLVVAEVAVSLTLLVGAGLLMRSFANLQRVTGGFTASPQNIVTMLISPGNRKYGDAKIGLAFYDEVVRRAREVRGVEMAAVADSLPPDRQADADSFGIEGQALAPGELNPIVTSATAGPGFFETLRVPLIQGRTFTDHDREDSTAVVIVSESFARRFFPNQNALGKRIRHSGAGSREPWMEIVGVVGDVKYLGLTSDGDAGFYRPSLQAYGSRMYLVARVSGDGSRAAAELRQSIQAIDPGVTLAQIGTMEAVLAQSVSLPRFDTMLLALFAAIALLLAAVGIYGLIAYSVAQRTHEIGVRMALGAARSGVVMMVVRQGASLAAAGIAIGLMGAFGLTRLLSSMLFGVGATDVVTFTAAAAAMVVVTLVATYVPAMRATRISPVIALRYE